MRRFPPPWTVEALLQGSERERTDSRLGLRPHRSARRWNCQVPESLRPSWPALPTVRAVLAAQACRVSELRSKEHRLRLRRGRQLGNRRMHMKKISVIGATLLGAAVLCAAPISLHLSQDKGMSLSVDKAQARIGRPLTPGSVAGVHRRYERRAYRRGYYGQGYYGHGGYYGPSQAAAPPGTPCRAAAKLEFPTDRKARHAYRHECKLAWKAQKKAA
jgi:hypothetical protein